MTPKNKPTHTPGPWMPCGNGAVLHPVTNKPITTAVVEASGWGRIGEWLDYSNEAEANARLIAAAPDLLAALKMLARDYDLEQRTCDPGSTAGIVRAAIAKAEGC